MSTYYPDRWVIIKLNLVKEPKPLYKVLIGLSGSYTEGDAWRVSSGIVNINEQGDIYFIYNHSGSQYICYKESEGMNAIMDGIFNMFSQEIEKLKSGTIEIVPIEEVRNMLQKEKHSVEKIQHDN